MNSKKIVNLINFVRAEDPRVEQDVLYNTFKNQVELCKSYPMPYTFLMQYDAMVRPEYAELLLNNDDTNMEVGVWIEMAQEQVEKVGLKWDGRPGFKWDWYVHPGMLMGYSIPERKLLIDELMERFRGIFGYYPRSAGSWLLDTYSIDYMIEKYNVESFCICKEQFGTDGYTLWGGYYNGGYFPCKNNLFIPAQTKEQQLGAPVFRMLGPDPIYQYDYGLDENYNCSDCQSVMTIEPCWSCGQNPDWVDWYLQSTFEEESLALAYTQIGQENPFTWQCFGEALKMQMKKIYEGYKENKWDVLTLGDTGKWFKETYQLTPAAALTALKDWKNDGHQTVWYNSRRYRANLYVENGHLFLRDMFIFDENYKERYWNEVVSGPAATYDTFPVVDGYRWSGNSVRCGWHFVNKNTCENAMGEITSVERTDSDSMRVNFLINGEKNVCEFSDESFIIELNSNVELLFRYGSLANTEIISVEKDCVLYRYNGNEYGFKCDGEISSVNNGYVIKPVNKTIKISFFVN